VTTTSPVQVRSHSQRRTAGASGILVRLFDLLEREGISYCVPHGYDELPERIASDVDIIMPADVLPGRLARLLRENQQHLGGRIVQWLGDRAHFIVLAGYNPDGSRCFLQLHVDSDYVLNRRVICPGPVLLDGRQRHKQWYVPSSDVEFACLLARRITKGQLDERSRRTLVRLYQHCPDACRDRTSELFGASAAAVIDDLRQVRPRQVSLRRQLLWRATFRHLGALMKHTVGALGRRAARVFQLDRGLHVVLLGPDGSGKSSVLRAVSHDLAPAFADTKRRSFPPGLRNRGKDVGTNSTPHEQAPRSFVGSCVRAVAYWFAYEQFGYPFTVRREKARNELIFHDRHLVDALVDPRRYRYTGPRWLLRLVWALLPKPDLVVLLDAPAETTHARKREVPLAETQRQREGYLALVQKLSYGRVIDASQPLGRVIADVDDAILDCLGSRAACQRRLGSS